MEGYFGCNEKPTIPAGAACAVHCSVVTSGSGLLTKRCRLTDGALSKSPAAQMTVGEGEDIAINLEELPGLIRSLKPNQALVHGVTGLAGKYPISSEKRYTGNPGEVTRTKRFFQYSASSALTMIDYDPPGDSPAHNPTQLIEAIGKVAPGFHECAKVITYSTSSCISTAEGTEITGDTSGYHVYFSVKHGRDIERFRDILFKRCWLKGYGYIKVSKSGALLERCRLFDPFVMSPERLDFVAGAVLEDGLVQKRPAPVYIAGGVLNTSGISDLSQAEEKAYNRAVEKAKAKLLGEAADARSKYISSKASKLSERRGISIEAATATVTRACCNGDLYGDYMLYFDAHGARTVAEALAEPARFDKETLYDPIEPDTGGKAIFYANRDGKPVVHSFKHGGHVFFIHAGPPPAVAPPRAYAEAESAISCISSSAEISAMWLALASGLQAADQKRLIDLVAVRTGATKGDLREDLKNYKRALSVPAVESGASCASQIDNLPYKPFWSEKVGANGSVSLKISFDSLYELIEARGIKKLIIDPNSRKHKTHILIRDNVMEEIYISDIRRMVADWIEELPEQISPNFKKTDLSDAMKRGIHSYVDDARLDMIEFKHIETLRDDADHSYVFFRNGFVEVTKDGYKLKDYKQLPGVIWKSQIIDFDIDVMQDFEADKSDFVTFLTRVCSTRDASGIAVMDDERYDSLCSVIGYLLHNYNDPAYSRAIILSDASLEDKPEGGSGKGLIAQAIGQIRKRCLIDGKNFSHDSQFALSQVGLDTQVVVFDDVRQHFSFERVFSYITDGYSVEKKYGDRFNFDFARNPKTLITTNYSIKGDGASFRRRKFEFELYNYYNDTHTPEMEFGRIFFSTQWDDRQWQYFYNACFYFIELFLRDGRRIREYGSETLELKKLQNKIGKEAIEFFDSLPTGEWIDSAESYDDFVSENLSSKAKATYSRKRFAEALKAFCSYKGYNLETARTASDGSRSRQFFISI